MSQRAFSQYTSPARPAALWSASKTPGISAWCAHCQGRPAHVGRTRLLRATRPHERTNPHSNPAGGRGSVPAGAGLDPPETTAPPKLGMHRRVSTRMRLTAFVAIRVGAPRPGTFTHIESARRRTTWSALGGMPRLVRTSHHERREPD